MTELSNQIRGLMKTFGLVVPGAKGGRFEAEVRRLLAGQVSLETVFLPLLEAWTAVRGRAAELGRQLLRLARHSEAWQRLLSIPGITTEFAVKNISKDSLDRYAAWPGERQRHNGWIS